MPGSAPAVILQEDQMTDNEMKIEVMYHLESVLDMIGGSHYHPSEPAPEFPPYKLEEIDKRLSAALYMVQAMCGGYRPDNFQTIINGPREIDAAEKARELMAQLKERCV
jgi:hypothetical protein